MIRYFVMLFTFLCFGFNVQAQDYVPKNDGVKQSFKNYSAIINATVYISSNKTIENASILIKEDRIISVGTGILIPKNATIIDAKGKTVYPSFIELFSEFGINKLQSKPNTNFTPQYDSNREGYYWNDHVKPEYNAYENLAYDSKAATSMREIGFGTVLSHQNDGIIAGTGLLWTFNDNVSNSKRILNKKIAQHFTFRRSAFSRQSYPSSLMGSMALIRQVYHDAKWYQQGGATTKDLSLEAFNSNKSLLQIFNAGDKLNEIRANTIGAEFNVAYLIKGLGNEFEQLEAIKKTKATYIVPISFPEAYDVSDGYLAQQLGLSDIKYWNQAPFNLKILAENNISFVITSADLKDQKNFLTNLRKAVLYGLPKEKALEALTETPAKILKQFDQIGSISKGKLANFIITSGDLFDSKSTIQENWVQGNRSIIEKSNVNDVRGLYDLAFNNQKYELKIEGEPNKLEGKIIKDSIKYGTKLQYNDPWLSLVIKDKDTLKPNFVRLSGIYSKDNKFQGKAVLENGIETSWTATKKEITEEKKDKEKKDIPKVPQMYPITFPNGAFGNTLKPTQETILFKNATVWTGEKEGNLNQTDVLIENGKIVKIGTNISSPNAKQIDGSGKFLTAGIIDEHSHIAISNGVNEGGQNCSAEVTIEDVINSEDINIYRNLAGGVTTSNLLHGSANPIGGRAALVKLKWGFSADEMLVKDAPKYIKFALGENVKQSNSGDFSRNRFPQSRMGVEQVYEDYFTRAIEYQKEWNAFKTSKDKAKFEPRYDIELEVLSEILNKKRFITCHSYVQSEINMLLKLSDRYHFKIQTFTHILEGYKVADKMKSHGVSGSTFADWWAYKFEVNDAIPYNAALMHQQGVQVSINSDDAEMSRRLNQEASKTMKYGNVSEIDAWNFVTINPAKILQVDDKIGSIKIGKDADVVLWSDNPLSIYAKVEKTIIDGILFYDSDKENQILQTIQKERSELINAMLDSKNSGMKTQLPTKKSTGYFHCETLGEFGEE
jgi:imidazolonepropionase-like amidohydrolase